MEAPRVPCQLRRAACCAPRGRTQTTWAQHLSAGAACLGWRGPEETLGHRTVSPALVPCSWSAVQPLPFKCSKEHPLV